MKPIDNTGGDITQPSGDSVDSTADSPFNTVSDVEISQWDRYYRIIDSFVFAPLRIALTDWRASVGLIIIVGFVLMGTVGIYIVAPPDQSGPQYLQPFQSWEYPLGTNNLGEGIFAQVVHATPAMLQMILAGAVFSTVLATVIGTVSGYKGGITDRVLTTFVDILMTIPGLPLVILIVVILEPRNPFVVGILLVVNAWAGLARAIRSQVLTIRDESYVEALRIMGAPTWKIITDDILPNLMPYILVNFVYTARQVIFSSVGLYFLGILPFSNENWGVMMNLAYKTGGALYTWETAHWLIAPMATIVILSLGLILFTQGMDRVFNPRVRARHARTVISDDESAMDDDETTMATEDMGVR